MFDAIWVVRSSSEISADRLVVNRGMDREDALKRMEAQLSRRGIGNLDEEIKSGCVTAVIENDGGNSCDVLGSESGYDDGYELWSKIQQCLVDPDAWKDGRCPKSILERDLSID